MFGKKARRIAELEAELDLQDGTIQQAAMELKSLLNEARELKNQDRCIIVHGMAIGTIKCWGEVIEHELGWRAQYAKLHSIDDVIGDVDINTLRERYKV